MKIIRNIIVAFSMYSRIPVPIFEWKEDDTKYAIAFLPLIGAVIAAMEYAVFLLGETYEAPMLARVMVWAAIPLLVTGGFHVDGFMDVQDALKSYKSKEEKLEILKDPHIGAFAVISLVLYGSLYLAGVDVLFEVGMRLALVASIGFYEVRCIAALLSVTLTLARNKGMLHAETKATNRISRMMILIETVIGAGAILLCDWIAGLVVGVVLILYIFWFRAKCYKEFGGITGDTIGYFITVGELLVMISLAAVTVF